MPISIFETFDMRSPETAHVKRLPLHVKRLTVDNFESLHVKRLVFLLTNLGSKTNAAQPRNA